MSKKVEDFIKEETKNVPITVYVSEKGRGVLGVIAHAMKLNDAEELVQKFCDDMIDKSLSKAKSIADEDEWKSNN